MPQRFTRAIPIFIKNFFTDYKAHLRAIIVSIFILSISVMNYFIGPFEYDQLIRPYSEAKCDYVFIIDNLTSELMINTSVLNDPLMLEIEFINYLNLSGIEYRDLVTVTYLNYNLLMAYIISDYKKIDLTQFKPLSAGRNIVGLFEAQVSTSIDVLGGYPSLGDEFKINNLAFKVVGQHIYSEGILIPYSKEVKEELEVDPTYNYICIFWEGSTKCN